jgi:hypothetical protein
MRRFVGAAVVALVTFGIAMAEEFGAVITKVEDGKVTFHKTKFNKETKKLEKGDAMTLPVGKDAKIAKGKNIGKGKVEVGDAIEGGLKAEVFSKISDKGLASRITTSDDGKSITQILVTGGGGKKKKDAK